MDVRLNVLVTPVLSIFGRISNLLFLSPLLSGKIQMGSIYNLVNWFFNSKTFVFLTPLLLGEDSGGVCF